MRDVSNDDRAAFCFDISSASVDQLLTWVYPSLYPVHDPSGDWGKPDAQGRCAPVTSKSFVSFRNLAGKEHLVEPRGKRRGYHPALFGSGRPLCQTL